MKNTFETRIIIILFTQAILLCFLLPGYGTTYYISANGNDELSGRSMADAWRSIERVNKFKPIAGDSILFRRGDFFTGTVVARASGKENAPVYYGAYGTGENPLIKGSVEISGWNKYSDNIFMASADFQIEQLFVDGSRATVARFPNEGYIYIDFVVGNTRLFSKGLNRLMDYSGATWYGRTTYWFGVIRKIISSESNILTLEDEPNGDLAVRQGFILMNKLEFLDQPGEWYYDDNQKVIYLWTAGNEIPGNARITASVHDDGFVLQHVSYVVVENFRFAEQNRNGIRLISTNQCTLSNNDISNTESYGIYEENSPGSANLTLTGNNISDSNGGGIWIWTRDSYISKNRISNTGVFAKLGLKGTTAPNGGSGAEISGVNNIIEYNVIENSNYNGLFYRGSGTDIRYNFFNNNCLVKDDGGAIYTNTSGSGGLIRHNIIVNSMGNPEGYISSRSMAEGIYVDEIAQNVVVEHNTILNTGDSGIKLHNVGSIRVRNNTVMTARYGIFCDKFVGEPSEITNNIICATSATDDYEPRSLLVRVVKYNASFDHNTYVSFFASEGIFRKEKYYNFEEWKVITGHDMHSTFVNKPLDKNETIKMFYNASKRVQTYSLNGASVRNLQGNVVVDYFTLQPYTSIILTGRNLDKIME